MLLPQAEKFLRFFSFEKQLSGRVRSSLLSNVRLTSDVMLQSAIGTCVSGVHSILRSVSELLFAKPVSSVFMAGSSHVALLEMPEHVIAREVWLFSYRHSQPVTGAGQGLYQKLLWGNVILGGGLNLADVT